MSIHQENKNFSQVPFVFSFVSSFFFLVCSFVSFAESLVVFLLLFLVLKAPQSRRLRRSGWEARTFGPSRRCGAITEYHCCAPQYKDKSIISLGYAFIYMSIWYMIINTIHYLCIATYTHTHTHTYIYIYTYIWNQSFREVPINFSLVNSWNNCEVRLD